jgi:hypothetical protein
MNQFIISRTKANIWDFIFKGFFSGTVFYVLTIFILIRNGLIGIVPLFFIIRYYIYKNIELLFNVRIVKDEGSLYLKMMWFTLSLDLNNCFLIIENVAVFTGIKPNTEYGLVLVRNEKKAINRIFKNRIKLYVGLSVTDLEDNMNLISNQFGIRSVPFFEDPNKW